MFKRADIWYRQLQQGKGLGEEGYNGMVDCFRKIVKNEGYRHNSEANTQLTGSQFLATVSRDYRSYLHGSSQEVDPFHSLRFQRLTRI